MKIGPEEGAGDYAKVLSCKSSKYPALLIEIDEFIKAL
jgi:hypothetical protein